MPGKCNRDSNSRPEDPHHVIRAHSRHTFRRPCRCGMFRQAGTEPPGLRGDDGPGTGQRPCGYRRHSFSAGRAAVRPERFSWKTPTQPYSRSLSNYRSRFCPMELTREYPTAAMSQVVSGYWDSHYRTTHKTHKSGLSGPSRKVQRKTHGHLWLPERWMEYDHQSQTSKTALSGCP